MNRFERMGLSGHASTAVFLLALVAWPSAARSAELGCVAVTPADIENLFVTWNLALQTENADRVVALHAPDAVLLPTVENGPYVGPGPIKGYFVHFLENKPRGVIDQRIIHIGCNVAFDAGLYTFTYGKQPKEPTAARYTYVYKYEG